MGSTVFCQYVFIEVLAYMFISKSSLLKQLLIVISSKSILFLYYHFDTGLLGFGEPVCIACLGGKPKRQKVFR